MESLHYLSSGNAPVPQLTDKSLKDRLEGNTDITPFGVKLN